MSAAETLKALDEEWLKKDHGWDSGPYDVGEQIVAWKLVAALPEIIELVEQVELMRRPTNVVARAIDALSAKLES